MRAYCEDCADRGGELCPLRPAQETVKEILKLSGEIALGAVAAFGEAAYSRGPLAAHKPAVDRAQRLISDSRVVKDCIDLHQGWEILVRNN